jgi:hypothetical protein
MSRSTASKSGKVKNFITESNNFVILNFWCPGYNKLEKNQTTDGVEYERKIFTPSFTPIAALPSIRRYSGRNDFRDFKQNASPGHVSLMTAEKYLSVGPHDSFSEVGLSTSHPMFFQSNFENECTGIRRLPEKMIVLHSLDAIEVNKKIDELISSKKPYSMLGSRSGIDPSGGENCATACYNCLVAGGIEELWSAPYKSIAKNSLLTAVILKWCVGMAKTEELKIYPHTGDMSKLFTDRIKPIILDIKKTNAIAEKLEIDAQINKNRGTSHNNGGP